MTLWFLICGLLIVGALLNALVVYACCVQAGQADDAMGLK